MMERMRYPMNVTSRLSAEYRKAKPNEGVVTELMAIRQRRQEIVEKAMLVRELLLKFPFLRNYEQVYNIGV